MAKILQCKYCDSLYHYSFQCYKRPKKEKQAAFEKWRDLIAKPYLKQTYGDKCACCKKYNKYYDLDHIKNVGSNPRLKMDIDNVQLLCRFPCHFNKTNHIKCEHSK